MRRDVVLLHLHTLCLRMQRFMPREVCGLCSNFTRVYTMFMYAQRCSVMQRNVCGVCSTFTRVYIVFAYAQKCSLFLCFYTWLLVQRDVHVLCSAVTHAYTVMLVQRDTHVLCAITHAYTMVACAEMFP
jgi:hypothetical protein